MTVCVSEAEIFQTTLVFLLHYPNYTVACEVPGYLAWAYGVRCLFYRHISSLCAEAGNRGGMQRPQAAFCRGCCRTWGGSVCLSPQCHCSSAVPALLGWETADEVLDSGEWGPSGAHCPTTFLPTLCLLPSDLEVIFTTILVCLKPGFLVMNFLVNVCFTTLRNFPSEDNLCLVYLGIFPFNFFHFKNSI